MGREGQRGGEYSREAYDKAESFVMGHRKLAGDVSKETVYDRKHGPHDAVYFLERFADIIGVSDFALVWKGLEKSEQRLLDMAAKGEKEAHELNEEHERLKQAAAEALRKLVEFEGEKLGMHASADTSQEAREETTVN